MNRRDYLRRAGGLAGLAALGAMDVPLMTARERFEAEVDDLDAELRERSEWPDTARIPLTSVNRSLDVDVEREVDIAYLKEARPDFFTAHEDDPGALYERAREDGRVPPVRDPLAGFVFEGEFRATVHPVCTGDTGPVHGLIDGAMDEGTIRRQVERAAATAADDLAEVSPRDVTSDIAVADVTDVGSDSRADTALFALAHPRLVSRETGIPQGMLLPMAFGDLNDEFHDDPASLPVYVTDREFETSYGMGDRYGAVVSLGSTGTGEMFTGTFEQEILHGLGIDHSGYRDSAMSLGYNPESDGTGYGRRVGDWFERLLDGEGEAELWTRLNGSGEEDDEPFIRYTWSPADLPEDYAEREQFRHAAVVVRDAYGFDPVAEMEPDEIERGDRTAIRFDAGDARAGLELVLDGNGYLAAAGPR